MGGRPRSRVGQRVILGVALALLLLGAAAMVRGPGATLDALREAAARGDEAELAHRIDLPALQYSLGRVLLQQMGDAMSGQGGGGTGLLGPAIVADALVTPLAKVLTTPSGIARLLDGQVTPRLPSSRDAAVAGDAASRTRLAWKDLSVVHATVTAPGGDGGLVLVLRRQGLDWQWAGVELPPPSPRP